MDNGQIPTGHSTGRAWQFADSLCHPRSAEPCTTGKVLCCASDWGIRVLFLSAHDCWMYRTQSIPYCFLFAFLYSHFNQVGAAILTVCQFFMHLLLYLPSRNSSCTTPWWSGVDKPENASTGHRLIFYNSFLLSCYYLRLFSHCTVHVLATYSHFIFLYFYCHD